jgi:hypothetical protein
MKKCIYYIRLDLNYNIIEKTPIYTRYLPVVHDFITTEDYLIFFDSPLEIDTKKLFCNSFPVSLTNETAYIHVLNKHTKVDELQTFLDGCRKGGDIGLLSEAGCPGVADPGAEMARIAQSHQVFCVTHLPQVASLAHQHLLVEKSQDEVSTSISIAPIQGDNAMRLEEIARMLGDRNSASAQQHAKALLKV